MNLFNFPLIQQLLVVVSSDWNTVEGFLCGYERDPLTLQWELSMGPIEVAVGKNGMAWGRGLQDFSVHKELVKQEGDQRSPAGIFYLGPAFGDASHQSYAQKIPFMLIEDDLECVDDPNSSYYNQFVSDNTEVRDWKSSEKMKEVGRLYAVGLVVQHNTRPVKAGMGSAIFMHIWRNWHSGTAGCTAMEENQLQKVVAWLDSSRHPCLVQLPIEEYAKKKAEWGLPDLNIDKQDLQVGKSAY